MTNILNCGTNLTSDQRLSLLKQFREVVYGSKKVYDSPGLAANFIKHSITKPKDLEPCLSYLDYLLEDNQNDITEITNILAKFINNSSKAILGRNDFTAFHDRGIISYLVMMTNEHATDDPVDTIKNMQEKTSEPIVKIYTYNVTKVLIDLGSMIEGNEKNISRFIRNAYNRLIVMLAIIGNERAIDLKKSIELNRADAEDTDLPKTIQSVIEQFSSHVDHVINQDQSACEERSSLTAMIRKVTNHDSFDCFMATITSGDLESHHYKIVGKTLVTVANRFKHHFNSNNISAIIDTISKNNKMIVESFVCPITQYGSNQRNADMLKCLQKVMQDMPPNTIKQGLRDYIEKLKPENLEALFSQAKAKGLDFIGDNPMSIENITQTQTRTVTKTVYR